MRLTLCSVAVAMVLAQSGQPLALRISTEAQRVSRTASAVAAEQRAAVDSRIDRARAAAGAGREYLAVYELEPAFELAEGSAYADAQHEVKDVDRFTALWRKAGAPTLPESRGATLPLVAEALAQAAAGRAPATYRASLPFARDAGIGAGLYYLGESHAMAHFAGFVRALPWPQPPARRTLRSIAPELDAFDRDVTRAYEGMTPAQHQGYMLTSVALKEAHALNDAGAHAGAMLEYLIARLRFAQVHPPAAATGVTQAIASARAASRDTDDSILELFLQLGEAAAARGTDADMQAAAAVANDIIPAYRAATATPATAAAAPSPDPAVTITLVRWPFT